jgi:hypothetical protein
MTRKINYEDDIFTLSLLLRTLGDVLKLEIDPEFFRERVESDIAFLDTAIGRIHQTLAASPFFLKKSEYLKGLQRLKRSFADLLKEIAAHTLPFAEFLPGAESRYAALAEAHARDALEIRTSLSQSGTGEEEQMVSEDEFKILMSPPEEGADRD